MAGIEPSSVTAPYQAEALAAEALRLVRADSGRAVGLADTALAIALEKDHPRAASMAERALGLAARERSDITGSALHLRRAIELAERADLPVCAAEARMSLAGTLLILGDSRAALGQADRAAEALKGVELARLQVQRATILYELGLLREALEGYRRAQPALRRANDSMWMALLVHNRGLAHLKLGALAAAEADLRRAEALNRELGQHRTVARLRGSLGLLNLLRGDIPGALACFDDADEYLRDQGVNDAAPVQTRCLALLTAGLVPEARARAEAAVKMLADEGRNAYLAKARLRLAEAALAGGDLAVAASEAAQARRAFTRQRRPAWAALARDVALRAAWLAGERSPTLVREARETAGALAVAGFRIQALDAEILGAQVALGLGRREAARRALFRARASRRRGSVQLRSRAWHAEALLRLADGNRRGADSALRAGMDTLEKYRAALGATELRVHAANHVSELAKLGIRLAVEDGGAERLLEWAERFRAGALRVSPARPPDDQRLAADLTRLRAVVAELYAAALAGRPTDRLLVRQAELEEAVRTRARHATGSLAAVIEPPPTARQVMSALGDHVLVELIDNGGELHAVVATSRNARLVHLASVDEVSREREALRYSLRRLSSGSGSEASLAAARNAADFGAKRLDNLLLSPVATEMGDRPLVIVPTTVLHALPWSALPACRDRPVSVVPSAALWLRAGRPHAEEAGGPRGGVTGRRVFIAGPNLAHAAKEVNSLARHYPDAHRFTGRRATCKAVCASLDGARLAHIASHARFRADNPLFSCLELVDGPLTVYDLERLRVAPGMLVLSSCDSGLSAVRPGDELMGLAAAVFAMGTTSLVASVFPVADEATRRLMLAFHANLRRGHPAAVALAEAQSRCREDGMTSYAAAAAFVCFGRGD